MRHMTFIAALMLSTLTHANAQTINDNCNNIARSWLGTYTMKHPEDCEKYHGCTHIVTATVSKITDTTFEVDLRPKSAPHGIYHITCMNGEIFSSEYKGGTIKLNCTERKNCGVIYDSPYVSSTLVTVKE